MLNVSGVSKFYPAPGGQLAVLTDVSLTCVPGDAAAIMGPSGTGKSTLLYIIGALEPPSSGTVTLDGIDPFALPARELAAYRNREIGFVFQDHCLLPQCTVLENVLIPTMVGAADGHSEAHARSLLDQVGLSARAGHLPGQLSGGEKQRAALARALVRRPRLLLCDEPTGNLDRRTADGVASVLAALQQQQRAMLIVVTHSAELAGRFPIRFELSDRALHRVA